MNEILVTAKRRGSTLLPGLPVLSAGLERHPVAGGGSTTLSIDAGDEILLEDRYGLQSCELMFFDCEGRSALGALGIEASGVAGAIPEILHSGIPSANRVREALAAAGCDVAQAEFGQVFGGESRAGARSRFTAGESGSLVVGVPGSPMAPDAWNPPSEIVLYLRRASPRNKPRHLPPSPLADPLEDFNLVPGSAKAYEVRAGQFIQILDVQGRECSDFQAWDMRALERGEVREIDPTTTRSMTGTAYPGPGIYAKYFSVGQEPMVEIVQDTVGRHDAFNLACTARYYADLGYPGHVNCSDNLNREAETYGISPRPGWPAINFFFNTMVDAANGMAAAEPWSRPGDFVLLRALTDLVCFSTACPSDVDSANAWEPTDIQVRVYDARQKFTRATAYRKTPDSEPDMTKETAFHERFAERTRNFSEYNGYWVSQDFPGQGAVSEYWACRERAAIMDLSPLRKYEVLGPDAETLMQSCVTRDMRRLAKGQVVYTAMCYEHGGMIDDGTVYRLCKDNFRWIGGCDKSGLWLREQADARGLNVWVKPSIDQLHNVALQGPSSRDILKKFVWTPPAQPSIEELGWFRFTVGRIGGFEGTAMVISRTGFTGELGYEVFCNPRDGTEVFDAIWEAGEEFRLSPLGLEALDTLRVEAGLVIAGQEFNDQTDPFEAGIGFTTPLKSKKDSFIGREALERRKAHPTRKLVGLDVEGGEIPASGDGLFVGRARVGEITSAIRSPSLGRVVALARTDILYSEVGTDLEIGMLDGEQKRIPVRVVRFPHYDPEKLRVRS